MTFFTKHRYVNESFKQESNPMPWPLSLYLFRSEVSVSFTDPNKQLPNVKSVFKFLNFKLVYKKYKDLLLFRDRNIIY